MRRRLHTFVLLLALASAGASGTAWALSASEIGCVLSVNHAGARVAQTTTDRFLGCLELHRRDRLPPGETIEQCLAAGGTKLTHTRNRTAAVFTRECVGPPPFGPTDATAVCDAYGRIILVRKLFGADVDAALVPSSVDPVTARCQRSAAFAVTKLARARVQAFEQCAATGLRDGTITSRDTMRVCLHADPRGAVAAARRAAHARVAQRCGDVTVAAAFPGECAGAPVAGLVDCLDEQVDCGTCLAVNDANHLGAGCHRFENGVAQLYCGDRPVTTQSMARQWDERILDAIRRDNPRPVVHARNLFHLSVAMYDAWAAYDATAKPYLTNEHAVSTDVARDRAIAIAFAAYRVLSDRYKPALALGGASSLVDFDTKMAELGFDRDYTIATGDGPVALGNRIGAAVVAFGQSDGANQATNYADPSYTPVNEPLVVKLPGITMVDPNRWQPLALDVIIGQNGVPLPDRIQKFVGSGWGAVTPFALTRSNPNDVYVDPGPPPMLGGAGDASFKSNALDVLRLSSRLTPDDATPMDIAPAAPNGYGNNPLGTNDGHGYAVNPVTGLPYPSQVVKRGDFGRVLAEFWADGPNSETPPGHWNALANYVAEHPLLAKRFGGSGPTLDDLEWDVKTYLAVNGALHDAAIAAWGVKRKYDYVRPISMIRYMGTRGQSSDSLGPSYDPNGLPLAADLVEVITAESAAPGERHAGLPCGVGAIAVRAWPGEPADVVNQYSGVHWLCADRWVPYQRKTFVTPPFAAYVSGHSTFSRAAAEVLAGLTGSPYFPGGLGEFAVSANGYLKFEIGPSTDLRLQWASYYDAADQAGISRLWGGIHVAADDFQGRIMGHQIGIDAFAKAATYFDGTAP